MCNSGIRENPLRLLSGDFSHRPASCAEALLLWLPRLTRIAKGAGSWQDAQDLLQIMCDQLVRSWPAISVAVRQGIASESWSSPSVQVQFKGSWSKVLRVPKRSLLMT